MRYKYKKYMIYPVHHLFVLSFTFLIVMYRSETNIMYHFAIYNHPHTFTGKSFKSFTKKFQILAFTQSAKKRISIKQFKHLNESKLSIL